MQIYIYIYIYIQWSLVNPETSLSGHNSMGTEFLNVFALLIQKSAFRIRKSKLGTKVSNYIKTCLDNPEIICPKIGKFEKSYMKIHSVE